MCHLFVKQGRSVLTHFHQTTWGDKPSPGPLSDSFWKLTHPLKSSSQGRSFHFLFLHLFLRQEDIPWAAVPRVKHTSLGDTWGRFCSTSYMSSWQRALACVLRDLDFSSVSDSWLCQCEQRTLVIVSHQWGFFVWTTRVVGTWCHPHAEQEVMFARN